MATPPQAGGDREQWVEVTESRLGGEEHAHQAPRTLAASAARCTVSSKTDGSAVAFAGSSGHVSTIAVAHRAHSPTMA